MSDHINVTNTLQALALMEEGYHLVLMKDKSAISFCIVDGEIYNTTLNKNHDRAKIGAIDRDEFARFLRPLLKAVSATAARDDDLLKTMIKVIRENKDKFK